VLRASPPRLTAPTAIGVGGGEIEGRGLGKVEFGLERTARGRGGPCVPRVCQLGISFVDATPSGERSALRSSPPGFLRERRDLRLGHLFGTDDRSTSEHGFHRDAESWSVADHHESDGRPGLREAVGQIKPNRGRPSSQRQAQTHAGTPEHCL
jgi:hypothetical protein